jgi:hypothetical protein
VRERIKRIQKPFAPFYTATHKKKFSTEFEKKRRMGLACGLVEIFIKISVGFKKVPES